MSSTAARPSSSFGYWRGVGSEGPLAYGQGSGYGQAHSGVGVFPQGSGPPAAASGWTPTITYLLIMILVEMVAFKLIARALK